MKPKYLLFPPVLALSTAANADVLALYANTNAASTAPSNTQVTSQVNGAAAVSGVTTSAMSGSGLNGNFNIFFLRNQFGGGLWITGSSPAGGGPASSNLWLGVNNQSWGAVASAVSTAHYLEFSVTADAGKTLDLNNLTFDWQAAINNQTNVASFGYQLFASKDGGAYAAVGGAGSKAVNDALGVSTDWGSLSSEDIDLNSLDGANAVTFRLAMNNPINTITGSFVQLFRNITVNGVAVSADYSAWIGSFPGASGATGFAQDPDKDGFMNGVEAYFGTDPSAPTQGLTQISQSGGVFKFHHPKSNQLPSDVTGGYQWSTDMMGWHTSGQTNAGGVTTTVSPVTLTDNVFPALDVIEVTATVTAGTTNSLFVRVVTSNP